MKLSRGQLTELKHRSPTKKELAEMKFMSDSGLTANAIGKQLSLDPKTIRKWLKSEVYQNDPKLNKFIEIGKEKEIWE